MHGESNQQLQIPGSSFQNHKSNFLRQEYSNAPLSALWVDSTKTDLHVYVWCGLGTRQDAFEEESEGQKKGGVLWLWPRATPPPDCRCRWCCTLTGGSWHFCMSENSACLCTRVSASLICQCRYLQLEAHWRWAIICIYAYTPFWIMDDMVCLSQGVIQTSTVLEGTVSYIVVSDFIVSRGVNSTVLGGKLLRWTESGGVGLLPSCPKGV